MKSTSILAALIFAASQSLTAQNYFHPDSTFEAEGYAIPQIAGDDSGKALVLQPADNKIVVVGQDGEYCLATRLLPNGLIDNSFGTNGYTTFQFENTSFNTEGNVVALQSDGKIVVGGGTPFSPGLARLLPNGNLDPSFGSGGKLVVNAIGFPSIEPVQGLAVQPDQKILMATSAWPVVPGSWVLLVMRFLPNGNPDNTFSGDGTAILDLSPSGSFRCSGLFLQPDGKILLVGNGNTGTIVRMLPNGSIDPTFGVDGIFYLPQGEIADISLSADGKIVVAGQSFPKMLVARLNSNGTFDSSFGAGGMVLTDFSGSTRANGVAIQPADQKIVVTGYQTNNKLLCGRYNVDGTIDQTFYPGGFYKQELNGAYNGLEKVILHPNGDILSVGFFQNQFSQNDLLALRLTNGVDLSPPVATFSASNTSGCAPLSVSFSDQSSNNPTAWNWQFQGGTPSSSTMQHPTVTYFTPGTYDVTLSTSNVGGSSSSTKNNFITVDPFPTASFTTSKNGLNVQFTNTSTNAISYAWDFGDGHTDTSSNPQHIYASEGTYIVKLTANGCGVSILESELTVMSSATKTPEWLQEIRLLPNPSRGIFSIEMKGTWSGEIAFAIFNQSGQMIFTETFTPQTHSFAQQFDLGNVMGGVYWLRVHAGGESWMEKLVVVR